jgi:hypothetical protein
MTESSGYIYAIKAVGTSCEVNEIGTGGGDDCGRYTGI